MTDFRKLSNHPHSTRRIEDMLFHIDVYMPGGLLDLCQDKYNEFKGQFRMSTTGKSKIGCDASHQFDLNKVESIANTLPDVKSNIFEVAANFDNSNNQPYSIKKFVARVPYDQENDISMVFFIKGHPVLLTAWLNPKTDIHKTLDRDIYIQSKKDRQERVAKMKNTINEVVKKSTIKSINKFLKNK